MDFYAQILISLLELTLSPVKKMKPILRNRKALSTVVTTLIILVVSVLLAGVVTMYAINITSTRTQQEQLKLSYQHIWVNGTGGAWAAVSIDNVGGKDVVIDKLQIRGVEASWSSVRYLRRAQALTTDLNKATPSTNWASFQYTTGTNGTFSTPTNDIPLKSGNTLVVYVLAPDSISLSDIGVTIGMTVFTENAQYYVETNVEAHESA